MKLRSSIVFISAVRLIVDPVYTIHMTEVLTGGSCPDMIAVARHWHVDIGPLLINWSNTPRDAFDTAVYIYNTACSLAHSGRGVPGVLGECFILLSCADLAMSRPYLENLTNNPSSEDLPSHHARRRPLIYIYDLPTIFNSRMLQYRHGAKSPFLRFAGLQNMLTYCEWSIPGLVCFIVKNRMTFDPRGNNGVEPWIVSAKATYVSRDAVKTTCNKERSRQKSFYMSSATYAYWPTFFFFLCEISVTLAVGSRQTQADCSHVCRKKWLLPQAL